MKRTVLIAAEAGIDPDGTGLVLRRPGCGDERGRAAAPAAAYQASGPLVTALAPVRSSGWRPDTA